MINSYKALSGRYLKDNKKRTILTIIGIILSVALITSICTFILTVQNTMIEKQKKEVGAFHVVVENPTSEDINKLEINPKIDQVGLSRIENSVPLIKDKLVEINYLNESAFELMNVQLEEGEMPKAENQIVIEKWILKYFEDGVNIGDIIEIPDGNGDIKGYALAGVIKDDWNSQREGMAKGYVKGSETALKSEGITALVQINEKADKLQVIDEIEESMGSSAKVSTNEQLLRLTGESSDTVINESIYMIVALVIGIVVLATVVVIYNAFQISVAERMKQIGLLRAIGTTKKQIINLVLREATIMILIGVPLGIFFGIVAVYCISFVFTKLSPTGEFSNLKVVLSPMAIILSGVIGAVSIYISAYLPARAAGKTSPLVAISSQALIKKEKRSRGGMFLGRFFKIDTAMALKNVKRNRKRFYVTVFSMAISVTLFVTFATFSKFSTNFADEVTESDNKDFGVFTNNNDENIKGLSEEVINEVSKIPNVDGVYKGYNMIQVQGLVDSNSIPGAVLQWAKESEEANGGYELFPKVTIEGKEKLRINVAIDIYDEAKLGKSDKYVKEGSIKDLKENEIIVVRNAMFYGERTLISPIANLKVGDEIPLDMDYYSYDENGKGQVRETDKYVNGDVKMMKVAAIVDVQPFMESTYSSMLNIIVSEAAAEALTKDNEYLKEEYYTRNLDLRLTDDSYEAEVDEALRLIEKTNPGMMYYNSIQAAKEEKAFNMQIVILLMGFTLVITLISGVNIVNTVTTNILLRKKELSALKAIGMTKKQMRKMITFEGVLFGLYGGILGSIIGTWFSYMLYSQMSNIRRFAFVFPWESIIIAMISVIAMGYLAALIPLRKLDKENIIEGIRGE